MLCNKTFFLIILIFALSGNFGSAIIEVLVSGDGDGEDYNNFVTLLPPKMLMSPQDSKKGLNRTGNVTFTSGVCVSVSVCVCVCVCVCV